MASKKLLNLQFVGSYPKVELLPTKHNFEFAIIGRSNVGKSSLINAINNKKIAKTSRTPGRTQHLVLFEYFKDRVLVDLPGYGYTKGGVSKQKTLYKLIIDYLQFSKKLKLLWILCDCRRELNEKDLQLIDWCEKVQLDWQLVVTKTDKISKSKLGLFSKQTQQALANYQHNVGINYTSSSKNTGIEQLLKTLEANTVDQLRIENP